MCFRWLGERVLDVRFARIRSCGFPDEVLLQGAGAFLRIRGHLHGNFHTAAEVVPGSFVCQ